MNQISCSPSSDHIRRPQRACSLGEKRLPQGTPLHNACYASVTTFGLSQTLTRLARRGRDGLWWTCD